MQKAINGETARVPDVGPSHTVGSGTVAAGVSLGWLQPLGLVGLSAFNYLMRILTLGFYHFWGKTEVRKRIWSAVRIEGEPLAYTGTGRELCLGFVLIFGVVLVPVALLSFGAVVAFGPQSVLLGAFQGLTYLVFFLLYGVGAHRAQRYRLSRTQWRGVAGSLAGSSWRYGLAHFWTGMLIPLTLGWIIPWRTTRLQRLVISQTRFGDRLFTFTATAGPLYARFLLLWTGTLTTLLVAGYLMMKVARGALLVRDAAAPQGWSYSPAAAASLVLIAVAAYIAYSVFSAWYRASQINHFARHTHYEGASFRSSVTAGGLMWLTISNFLIVILTLGLLTPVAQGRSARYFVEHLAIDGAIDFGGVARGTDNGDRTGEGLAQAFDVDAF